MTKHLQIASGAATNGEGKSGPKAGFNFYMASTAPTAKATQEQIRNSGGKTAQFDAYCAKFGEQFGKGVNTAAREVHDADERMSVLEKAAAKLGLSIRKPEPVVTQTQSALEAVMALADELGVEFVDNTPAKPAPKARKPKAAPASTEDKFAPKNPDANATGGRLWHLNNAGLLRIVDKAGNPITAGEAHTILSQIL